MKLASIALALLQLTAAASSRRTEEDAGQCLAAASGYYDYYDANSNSGQYANEGAEDYNAQAAYYANNAEYGVDTNLAGLAETLGLEIAADGDTNMYMSLAASGHVSNYYDEEQASALGVNGEDAYETLYTILYELAIGGGLGNVHFEDTDDEDANEMNEALNQLTLHVRVEAALDTADLTSDAGEGSYASVLEALHIDEGELDQGTMNDLKAKVAFKDGSFKTFLGENAPYGQNVEDWGQLLVNFLASIGLENYSVDDIDSYMAADIYNIEYKFEEEGCQAAMVEQYGAEEAASRGYIVDQAIFLQDSLSTGSKAGIAAGVVIVVGAVATLIAFLGRSRAAAEKATPLVDGKTGAVASYIAARRGSKATPDAEASHGYRLDAEKTAADTIC